MPKTIVFCADGALEGPGDNVQTLDAGDPKLTNVCKLSGWLQGAIDGDWGTREMELVPGSGDLPGDAFAAVDAITAVSVDEQRKSFQPMLWDDAPNVTQALFAAGHTDVGGGNPEHALSDVPLLWFIDRLQQPDVGLLFQRNPRTLVSPVPCACAHRVDGRSAWAMALAMN